VPSAPSKVATKFPLASNTFADFALHYKIIGIQDSPKNLLSLPLSLHYRSAKQYSITTIICHASGGKN